MKNNNKRKNNSNHKNNNNNNNYLKMNCNNKQQKQRKPQRWLEAFNTTTTIIIKMNRRRNQSTRRRRSSRTMKSHTSASFKFIPKTDLTSKITPSTVKTSSSIERIASTATTALSGAFFLLNSMMLTAAAATQLTATTTTTTILPTTSDFYAIIDDADVDDSFTAILRFDTNKTIDINNDDNSNTSQNIDNRNISSLNDDNIEYIFDNNCVRISFIVLYTLCFCCCVFGNLLVILVVTCSRRLRSITNFFLANLAVADFCVGVFCVMQNLSIYLIDSWVFGEFLCRMYQFVHSLSYTASIFILVVICTERYFAIVHPITCKQILTAARLRLVIVTVWITAAVYSTPKFIFSKTIENVHEDGHEEEICVLDRKMYNSKVLDMINFVLLYAIPLAVMTVLYSKIAITLWRSSRGWSQHIAQQHDNGFGLQSSVHQNQQQQPTQQQKPKQQQQQQPKQHPHLVNASSSSGSSTPATGSMLSRKQSSVAYEKRCVSITESQVSLESERPVVSTCRSSRTSFHHHLQQPAHAPKRAASHMPHSSSNVLRARRGVVRMLIIFVLTFAICNLPIHARKMWQYWGRSYRGDSNFNALLTPLTFLCSYFNSGVNPLLYAFLSRNFRKGMKELLMCSWKKSKTKSSSNSSMHHKRIALQTHSLPTDTTHIGTEQL